MNVRLCLACRETRVRRRWKRLSLYKPSPPLHSSSPALPTRNFKMLIPKTGSGSLFLLTPASKPFPSTQPTIHLVYGSPCFHTPHHFSHSPLYSPFVAVCATIYSAAITAPKTETNYTPRLLPRTHTSASSNRLKGQNTPSFIKNSRAQEIIHYILLFVLAKKNHSLLESISVRVRA